MPEKSSFGRFDGQFIQQRRAALEKCIIKIANHPVLAKDPDLKLFLESDTFSLDVSDDFRLGCLRGCALTYNADRSSTGR